MIALALLSLAALPPSVQLEGDWSADDRAALEWGFERLPSAVQNFPGGPLVLELHSSPAPLGLGEWADGHRRLHFYGWAPTDDRRATWRLERLSVDEQRRLWRARGLIHAVMQRWEDAKHFSNSPLWRRLNGWVFAGERVFTWSQRHLNLADAAFGRHLGQQSAELDWLTFAEEHFAPAEALRPGALRPDDSVACQEFSKARVMNSLLSWAGLVTANSARPSCPAFDAWVDLKRFSHLEILLVQASGRAAESLFGHVLLRPVHVPDGRVQGPSFDTAIQLAAITDPNAGANHLVTGLFGGYRMTVFTLSMRDLEREMLEDEQRTMRRFRMELPVELSLRVLERAWELERRGYYNYQFFSDNCATALVWLFQGALSDEVQIELPNYPIVAPAPVLDRIAETEFRGKKLLTHLPEDLESSTDRSVRSEAQRLTLEKSFPSEWAPWLHRLRAPDVRVRLAAYRKLRDLSREAPTPALYDWWALSVRLERFEADRADHTLNQLDLHTIAPANDLPFDFEGEVAERQQQFERETSLQRNLMMLDRSARTRELVSKLPRRPLTDDERTDRDAAYRARAFFESLTGLHGDLVSELWPEVDGQDFLERDLQQRRQAQVELEEISLPASGHFRTALGGGVFASPDGAAHPMITLRTGGLWEALGDQRIRGFRSSAEIRVLEGDLWLEPKAGWPEVLQSRFTLFAYRSLQRDLPQFRSGNLADMGWGFEAQTDYRLGRRLSARTTLSAEALVIAAHDGRFASHLALSAGAAGFIGWDELSFSPALGAYVGALARVALPGHGQNALRLEGRYQLSLAPALRHVWLNEASARLGVEQKVGPLMIRPEFCAFAERVGDATWQASLAGFLAFELL